MECFNISHIFLFLILQGFVIFLFQLLSDGLSLEDLSSFLNAGTTSQERFEEKLNPFDKTDSKDE